jgi:hypothetical protein
MLGTTMPKSRDWEQDVCSGTEIDNMLFHKVFGEWISEPHAQRTVGLNVLLINF